MQQIKLFRGIENELGALEKEVNAWVASTGARVLSVHGNMTPQSQFKGQPQGALTRGAFAPSDVFLVLLCELPDKPSS